MIRFAAPAFAPVLAPALTALALMTAPAGATDLTDMSDSENAAFGAAVRAYLLDNPEVIFEAVELFKQRQAQLEANADIQLVADNAEAIFNDGYSWIGGNPDGDVTLVEFMDYRCGYCRRAVPEIAKLMQADGNIRLIIKEMPILGEASVLSSRFAVATKQIAGDDAYKQVHDALLEISSDISDVVLRRLSDGLGLDTDAIMARMDSDEVTAELAATRDLAQKMNISGTPTFVLGSELLRGFLPADQLELIVADQRDKS